MSSPDVICLGILVTDVLARPVKNYPERGRLILVDNIEVHIGGCAANTGIGLAKLGVRTGVMGKIGNDNFGDFVVDTLKNNGVDTSAILADSEAATSATMVIIHPDGERSFIHQIGANRTVRESELDASFLRQAGHLHVAGAFLMPGFDGQPMANVLKNAKEWGLRTSLDTAWDSSGQWLDVLGTSLPYVDYFLPSIEEARMLAGCEEPSQIAERFLDLGVKVVALKMGEAGCYVRTRNEELRESIFAVNTVDATGAGDAFAAGFLAGVVRRWSLKNTARLANAVGACCVTAIGTTKGIRNLDETIRMFDIDPGK